MKRAVRYLPSVARDFDALPARCLREVVALIESLVEDPAPPDSKRLIGHEDYCRVPCCEYRYRLVYRIRPEKILIARIRLRGEVYAGL